MENYNEKLLDIAYRVILSGRNSYLVLQEELLRITEADICACFISEGRLNDLKFSCREGIDLDIAKKYLINLNGKQCYQKKIKRDTIASLRQFWKRHSQNQHAFAAIWGASDKLITQLIAKEYYIAVKIESISPRLEPFPTSGESINRYCLELQEVKEKKFQGSIVSRQIILPNQSLTENSLLVDDIISAAEFHLLPPYPFSVISIPLGFTYSTNFQEREFISIGLAWLGTENAYAIDLDISVVEKVVTLCRCVAHEVITNSLVPNHLLHMLWDIDSLVNNAGLTPRQKEALILVLQNYDDAQIKQYFAPCKKTGRPGINSTSVTQLLQIFRDKIKSHLQGSEETRRKLQEQNITLNSFPTSLVKRALMCSEYYRDDK